MQGHQARAHLRAGTQRPLTTLLPAMSPLQVLRFWDVVRYNDEPALARWVKRLQGALGTYTTRYLARCAVRKSDPSGKERVLPMAWEHEDGFVWMRAKEVRGRGVVYVCV